MGGMRTGEGWGEGDFAIRDGTVKQGENEHPERGGQKKGPLWKQKAV